MMSISLKNKKIAKSVTIDKACYDKVISFQEKEERESFSDALNLIIKRFKQAKH